MVKKLPANTQDTRDKHSISGSGRFPGVGKGNPLRYLCLGNPRDRGAWWATVHEVTEPHTTEPQQQHSLGALVLLQRLETEGSKLCSHNRQAEPCLNPEINLLEGTGFPSSGKAVSILCCSPQEQVNSSCPGLMCVFQGYQSTGLAQRSLFNLQIYAVLGLFWTINWVLALGQCVLAGAFASFYWAFHKPRDIPTFPLGSAVLRTLR